MDCWGAFSVTADWSHHSDILHCLPCIYLLQQQSALRFFSLPFKESIEETTLSSAHFFISIVSKHRLQLWASEFVQEPASFSIFVAMIENRRVSAWWAVNSSPKAQFVVCLKKKKGKGLFWFERDSCHYLWIILIISSNMQWFASNEPCSPKMWQDIDPGC